MTARPMEIDKATSTLTARTGLGAIVELQRIQTGGNNRVYRLTCTDGEALLKEYFRHPDDPRDRLHHEYAYASFLWENGLRSIPQPLAQDSEAGVALYSFLAGNPYSPGSVTETDIRQAAEFVRRTNSLAGKPAAKELPRASEACFSLRAHLACVDKRIAKLRQIDRHDAIGLQASDFVNGSLLPRWQQIRDKVGAIAPESLSAVLPNQQRCLSPSDFGFHNALRDIDGMVRFYDFEYAGWDDPAKLVCDFFRQPRIPISDMWLEIFLEAAFKGLGFDIPALRRRIHLLLEVYAVKWCCIMLNEFLPTGRSRREFSNRSSIGTITLKKKLEQTQAYFRKKLHTEPHG